MSEIKLKYYQNQSFGDKGSEIESLTIKIPSCPNLIVDFRPIQNPTTKSYHHDFDLFLIKMAHFQSIFDLKIEKDDFKVDEKIKKSIKTSKLSNLIKKVDIFQLFDLFRSLSISFAIN